MEKRHRFLLLLFALLQVFSSARSQPYIGVNYGEVADNLPPPESTARLLRSTTISRLRLYGADPAVLRALAGGNISVVVGTSNGDIPSLAASPSAASAWLSANLLPFLPGTPVSAVSVGNEVLSSGDPSLGPLLLPAMTNLRSALSGAGAGDGIKVTTVHSMAVLSQSEPPSSGAFHSDLSANLNPVIQFLQQTQSPFMINPYPYFAYRDDPRPETLAFCLFQANPGRADSGSGLTYTNMFDAQVDAVRAALAAAGFAGVEVVVAETGWPYQGDAGEAGATVENARAFVGGLVGHLRSGAGTPAAPGTTVETYLFALYDEDLKPGPTSERSFGLFRTDGTENYDTGLLLASGAGPSPSPSQASTPPASAVATAARCVPGAAPATNGDRCYLPSAAGSGASPSSMVGLLRRHTGYGVASWHTLSFSLNVLFYAALQLFLI